MKENYQEFGLSSVFLGASKHFFASGNFCGTAVGNGTESWQHAAALGLIGHSKPAIAGLENIDNDQARFYLAATLWIQANEAEAIELLKKCALPEAKRLLDLILNSMWILTLDLFPKSIE